LKRIISGVVTASGRLEGAKARGGLIAPAMLVAGRGVQRRGRRKKYGRKR